jgi:hypothetical protein
MCCSLNTVVHEPAENSLALGRVGRDRYWQGTHVEHQLNALGRSLSPHDIVILLTHHPVHDPNLHYDEALTSVLMNAPDVAASLHCRAVVVVSGHTHGLFPPSGSLPHAAGRPPHDPLAHRQAQLIGGTLSQRTVGDFHPDYEHSWQLLRFWEEVSSEQVTIERKVFRRMAGAGAFTVRESGTEKMRL